MRSLLFAAVAIGGRVGSSLAAILLGQTYQIPKPRLRDTIWRHLESGGIDVRTGLTGRTPQGASAGASGHDQMPVELGCDLADAQKLDEAEAVFRFNLLHRPTSAYSLDGLADAAIARGEGAKAISFLEQSLKN